MTTTTTNNEQQTTIHNNQDDDDGDDDEGTNDERRTTAAAVLFCKVVVIIIGGSNKRCCNVVFLTNKDDHKPEPTYHTWVTRSNTRLSCTHQSISTFARDPLLSIEQFYYVEAFAQLFFVIQLGLFSTTCQHESWRRRI